MTPYSWGNGNVDAMDVQASEPGLTPRVPAADAYSRRASEYVEAVGKIEHAAAEDREFVLEWARGIRGPVLDVGCGPGQWTDFLRKHGADVEGLDPSTAFVEHARRSYPLSRYRLGRAESLGVESGSLGCVLAWYSLIHTEPSEIDVALAEFARAVQPGGGLLLGFFAGARLEAFDHAITTAYYWPADALAERVERAGFTVTETQVREGPGKRPEARLCAQRERW